MLEAEKNNQQFDDDREVLLEKIMHYPQFPNFRTQLRHADFTQYYTCVLTLSTLRNDIAQCLDTLAKNRRALEKMRAKSTNTNTRTQTQHHTKTHTHHTAKKETAKQTPAETYAEESDDADYAGMY